MIADKFMGIVEAGLKMLGIVKIHSFHVEQVVDEVEIPEEKEDLQWNDKVKHLRNILENHTDLDAVIAAGMELIYMYTEKKDYESLRLDLAEWRAALGYEWYSGEPVLPVSD